MNGISLQTQGTAIKESRSFDGTVVPWEVRGFEEDFRASETGGIFDLSHWQTVEVEGPDARDFLNRLSTRDLRGSFRDKMLPLAFLTGKAQVIALGRIEERSAESFLLHFSPPQGTTAAGHLDRFHFGEKLEVRDVSDQWVWFAVFRGSMPETEPGVRFSHAGAEFWRDDADPRLAWVRCARTEAPAFLERFLADGGALLGLRLFEYFRVEVGAVDVGRGLREGELILEADLGSLISRAKGCYPGQEVVERIFTYGNVNQKLVPVRGEAGAEVRCPLALQAEGEKAGELVYWTVGPQDPSSGVGFARVKRKFWDRTEAFTGESRIKITLIP